MYKITFLLIDFFRIVQNDHKKNYADSQMYCVNADSILAILDHPYDYKVAIYMYSKIN